MTLFACWFLPSSGSAQANGASLLLAQETPESGAYSLAAAGQPPSALLLALDRIKPASRIRIAAPELGVLEGTLGSRSGQTLLLLSPSGAREVPIESVRTLWVRGRATGRGAKVGGITVGILGGVALPLLVAFACAVSEGGCHNDSSERYVGAAVIGAAGGGAIGALVGAGVGAAFPKWHQRFP
jgi:hypothetical protein